MQGKHELDLESWFKDKTFMSQLYLVDIFDQLNCLNLKLKGKETTVNQLIDALNSFVQKFENRKRKAENGICNV